MEDDTLPPTPAFVDVLGHPIEPGDVLVCPRNTTIMFALVDHVSLGTLWVRTIRIGDTAIYGSPVRRLRLNPAEEAFNLGRVDWVDDVG